MKIVGTHDVRDWLIGTGHLTEFTRKWGHRPPDEDFVEQALQLPLHLQFTIEQLTREQPGEDIADSALDSISFFSLCKGLLLPLSYLTDDRASQLFGFRAPPPPGATAGLSSSANVAPTTAAAKEKLLETFLDKEIGLSLVEKLGCALGDVFLGSKSTFRRDSLLRLLSSVQLATRRQVLDRLTRVGDVAVLFAESRPSVRSDPPLTAAEVIRALRFLPGQRLTVKYNVLRSLLARCGKMEAFFLAKLLLRKAGFGLEYQGPMLARALAARFGVSEEAVSHAMALTDVFHVAKTLTAQGAEGLKKIQLQPLVPVKPTLAGGTTDDIDAFPVWVERKYDGIRLMLHKSTDARGSILCGAYTRNRGDWLELVPGLDSTISLLPARNAILDGELYGTVLDLDDDRSTGARSAVSRPATVYEVYAALQGQPLVPVNLKFAAFDLILLNGQDLTSLPLSQRRQMLQSLVAPVQTMGSPLPLSVAAGQLAEGKEDLNRLFHHFRAQGYEGIITKDLAAPYLLGTRDPHWRKRKPEVTLDLVIVGATLAVTTKQQAGGTPWAGRGGAFGSYVIAARTQQGGWEIVGDVAGVDRVRDWEIQQEIIRGGLLTGRRIERSSASGVRPGFELRPSIVVTVKFEGITRDQGTGPPSHGPPSHGPLSLRDPKIAVIRSDKPAIEADLIGALREIYLRQRVG